MSTPDLPSAERKLGRARSHIDELHDRITSYQSEPFPFKVKAEPYDDGCRYRLVVLEEIPDEIPLVLGDAVHNLRAALDHAICELIQHRGKEVRRQHHFPMLSSRNQDPDGAIERSVGDAGEAVVDAVGREEPREGAENPLYDLHRLDIQDKHILIPTTLVAGAVDAAEGGRIPQIMSGFGRLTEAQLREMSRKMGVFVRSAVGYSHGDVVFVDRDAKEPNPHMRFRFEVGIEHPGDSRVTPIFPWLGDTQRHVEGVIEGLRAAAAS